MSDILLEHIIKWDMIITYINRDINAHTYYYHV